ncbi:WD40 repeat protein [Pseudosporangium ferrugineum]|uniref:WD40 repeat protein n=1 Tax=Pseudosporangium ferrugineum TaxID=439699 RepID=A0A2T0SBK3_9ACTN|nr:WD40 repeat protein [Pseudosporangium ferrugineum]
MPRPERPLDGQDGPVVQLAAELRQLREKAGRPGYRQMAARANFSVATLSAAASGRRLPTLEVTLAYVAACDGDRAEWERRWREAERLSVAPAGDPAAADGAQTSPYLGLTTFQPEDAKLFFGRDALVAELVRRLGERRFLAVFGPSGAGKSSVVRAGLVPAVGGASMVLTPGVHPMTELAVHLARHAGVPAGGLLDELRADPGRASLMVRQGLSGTPGDGDLLVVVDQFEEVFASCPDPAERAGFVDALLAMCREPDCRARVVLAVRADHYARFTELPQLPAALTDAQVLIGGMSPAELREAVTRPAETCGARVEGALVATIVAEVADSPGALPLAAHALREAWQRRQGAMVTLAGYQAAGGVAGAVAHTAEQVYERLSERERDVARRVLLRMVDVGQDGLITRRRLSRAELATIEHAAAVAGAFVDARLVSTDRDTVEVAHEALIRGWPRLRGWVEESRAGLRLHRQLTEAAAAWVALGRDEGALYRGLRLSATEEATRAELLDPSGVEREFLEVSREREAGENRSRQRRVRLALIGLAAGVTVMSLVAALAFREANRANDERERALSHQLVANARDQSQVDQELAVLLARAAYDTKPTAEASAVLRRAVADSRMRTSLSSGQQQVFGVAYSPDGRHVASSGADGTVRVWMLTGPDTVAQPPRVLRDHEGYVRIPAFSADGRYLAGSGVDGIVTVWDLSTGAPPLELRGHGGEVSAVAFSPDGRLVAGAGNDGTVRIWDRPSGNPRPVRALPLAGGPARAVTFSPDGVHLAAAGGDGTVAVWKLGATAPPVLLKGHEDTVWSLAYSPDGRRLASASADQTIRVWPTTGGGPPAVLRADDGTVETVAFSPDGRRLASGHSGSDTIRVWDAAPGDGEDPLLLHGHDGPVWSVDFSPDGRRLLSGGGDGTLRIWDPAYPGDPRVLDGHRGPAWTVAVSADGNTIASGGADHTVRVWRGPSPAGPLVLKGHGDEVLSVALTADGARVASASRDATVRVWDTRSGAPVAVLRGHPKTVWSVALSPDGRRVVSGGADNAVRIWDVGAAGPPLMLEGHEASIRGVAFSPDGRQVASTSQDTTVRLWNADGRGDPVVLRGNPGLVWTAAYAPDGRSIATGGDDGNIRIWSTTGREAPRILRGHRGPVWSVAFSPDGRQIVSAGHDSTERVWDTATGDEIVSLHGHGTFVEQSLFGPGGTLVSAHGDGTVRVTRCAVCGPIDHVLELADAQVTRALTADERRLYLHE